jgi:multiple sugar transport system permease protein
MLNRDNTQAFFFIFPLIALTFLFIFVPLIGNFWLTFFKDITFLPKEFIGLKNYFTLLKDIEFWQSAVFTLLFSFVSVGCELILGLMIALVINVRFKFRGIVRGIVLLPWAIPAAISARTWQLLYQYNYGVLNHLLEKVFGFKVHFLGSFCLAFISLSVADIWRTTPFVAIILLAGLQVIPEDLYKQAQVDGAGIFQRFTKVTLPLLKPIFIVALLFRTIDALRVFDIIYVITAGGPGGSTTSLSLYSYKYFLAGNFGYGASVSFFLFLIALCISLIYLKVSRLKRELEY